MLNVTKTVSCFVIKIARQTDSKLMHPSEKFRQNPLVKSYFIKDFNFLKDELKHTRILVRGLW